MRTRRLALLTAGALWLSMGGAFAHAHLKSSDPAADGTVATAPSRVAIVFTEGVEAALSGIEVTDSSGQRIDDGAAHLVDGDAKHLAVALKPAKAGTVSVKWHATSIDTHKTSGTFSFTVKP